jgi:DNA-binding MarR family transcriptional regulator
MIMKEIIEKTISENSCNYGRYLMGEARHLMLQTRKKELAQYHVTPQQSYIICIIYTLHKTTLTELARVTNRGINTLSSVMTTMERDGLVKKTREKPKSTLLSFELTEKGLDAYNRGNNSKATQTIMSVLSEEERQQLISMLKRIIAKAKKYKVN